jgi:hypothetical protein
MGQALSNLCNGDVTLKKEIKSSLNCAETDVKEPHQDEDLIAGKSKAINTSRAPVNIEEHDKPIVEIQQENEERIHAIKLFDENLPQFGVYISETEFENKMNTKVKDLSFTLERFTGTDEELGAFRTRTFEKDPIFFPEEGFSYKGSWNYNGRKEGYGVMIKKDGSRYDGFWVDDKYEGRGRLIEVKGSYYEGN